MGPKAKAISLLIFVGLVALAVYFQRLNIVGIDNKLYAQLSLNVKIVFDKPRCLMEELGLVSVRRGYYSGAAKTTIDLFRCRVDGEKIIAGNKLPSSIIVVSDLGGVVEKIGENGRIEWRQYFINPRGISIESDKLYIADIDVLHVLLVKTGEIIASKNFPYNIAKIRSKDKYLWVMSMEEDSNLYQYKWDDNELRLIKTIGNLGYYARDFVVNGDSIYVADTYRHEVSEYSRHDQRKVQSLSSYFPNSVQILYDSVLLISEEHFNSISEMDFNSKQRIVLFSCGIDGGIQLVDELRKFVESDAAFFIEKKCRSSGTNSGDVDENLYSPNDAYQLGENIYIADTDNHRVLIVNRNTGARTIIKNFNSPVGIHPVD